MLDHDNASASVVKRVNTKSSKRWDMTLYNNQRNQQLAPNLVGMPTKLVAVVKFQATRKYYLHTN